MWGVRAVTALFTLLWSSLGVPGIAGKPTVDPGLFMILGVETCRSGEGYCLLGLDCTLDDDFLPDDSNGHCDGLKNAFTPAAHFTCCKYNSERAHLTTSKRPRPGVMKPITTTTTVLVNTSSTTTANEIEEPTTTTVPENTMEPNVTTSDANTYSDIFVDLNNEVLKEVTPPSLVYEIPIKVCTTNDSC